MDELRVDNAFVNSEEIGDFVSILMPAFDGEEFIPYEEETAEETAQSAPAEEAVEEPKAEEPTEEETKPEEAEPAEAAEAPAEDALDEAAPAEDAAEEAEAAPADAAEAPAEEAAEEPKAEDVSLGFEQPKAKAKKKSKAKQDNAPEEIRIHYLEAGAGEPMLLIHGIGQSLYTWHAIFNELSESYRVIAIDLPGHGYSSRPERYAYSMDETAEAIYRFLCAKGIQSAHMIGFSTGAIYMMRLITLHPECVANCIAIAPGGISKYMPKLYHRMKNAFGAVFTRNLYSVGDVRNILSDCFVDESLVTEHEVHQYYNPVSDGLTREAMTYAVTNFDLRGTSDEMRYSDHEVLCVWGREDQLHPANGSTYFQDVLQNGRYYMIKEAGHLVHEEMPERFIDVVLSYIPPAVGGYTYDYQTKGID